MLTKESTWILERANIEARRCKYPFTCTHHILRILALNEVSISGSVIQECGLTTDDFQTYSDCHPAPKHLAEWDGPKPVERVLANAKRLVDGPISPEYLLLGILDMPGTNGYTLLTRSRAANEVKALVWIKILDALEPYLMALDY